MEKSNQQAGYRHDNHHHGWASERLVSDPAEYYHLLVTELSQAQVSIELVVYIFRDDRVGQPVVDALIAAQARGVQVRVIVDGFGSGDFAKIIANKLTVSGVEIRIYHPLPWAWSNYRWSLAKGNFFKKFTHFFSRLNRRDHRKLCIVDQQVAWCGSFNICADHLGKVLPWRDYAVRISGSRVEELVATFNSDWAAQPPKISTRSLRLIQGNNSLRLRWLRNRSMLQRIKQAKRRVWICNAYFSPSGAVLRAIKLARSRGVEVKVIVAGRSDIPFFPALTSTYYDDLLALGVDIYIYQRGILHAKVVLVDEQCVLGSSNLNHRSFYHDLELDVVLSSANTIADIEQSLQLDMRDSRLATLEDASPFRRTMGFAWLLRVLRYWL